MLGIVIIVSGVCFLGCALGGGLAAAVGVAAVVVGVVGVDNSQLKKDKL